MVTGNVENVVPLAPEAEAIRRYVAWRDGEAAAARFVDRLAREDVDLDGWDREGEPRGTSFSKILKDTARVADLALSEQEDGGTDERDD